MLQSVKLEYLSIYDDPVRDVTVFRKSPQWLFVAPSFTETSEFLLFEKNKNSPRSLVVVMLGSEKCSVCPFASTNNK